LAPPKCVNYCWAKTDKIFDWDFARDGERIVLPLEGYVAVNDGDAYLAAGRAGLGIIQAMALQVQSDLDSGRLVQILSDWKSDPLSVYVMYPQNRHLSAKVHVVVDCLTYLCR